MVIVMVAVLESLLFSFKTNVIRALIDLCKSKWQSNGIQCILHNDKLKGGKPKDGSINEGGMLLIQIFRRISLHALHWGRWRKWKTQKSHTVFPTRNHEIPPNCLWQQRVSKVTLLSLPLFTFGLGKSNATEIKCVVSGLLTVYFLLVTLTQM